MAPASAGCAGHPNASFCDDFSDNTTDSSRWVRRIIGAGDIDIQETNGRLEASLGPNVTPFTDTGFGALYESRCELRGDFDIEIGFELLQWPAVNGVRVGFLLTDPDAPDGVGPIGSVALSRVSIGSGVAESYRLFFNPDPEGAFKADPTTDSSGKLRLVRSADIITGYYLSGGTWIALGPGSRAPADRLKVRFGIRSNSISFAHQVTRVALDDFVVNQGTLVCPEAPTTCSQVLFEDNFDGSALDPARWNVVTNGYPEPAYSVIDGHVQVGRPNIPSSNFPLITAAANPFPPTGDFSLEVAMQYTKVEAYGDGFRLSGPNDEFVFDIWQGTVNVGLVGALGRQDWVVNPNLTLHRYRFEVVRDIATVYVDDVAVMSQPLAVRPTKLWFGNANLNPRPALPFTIFQIDSIRVSRACTSPPLLVEDFDSNQIDPNRWQQGSFGIGPVLNTTGQRLEITIPANSTGAGAGGTGNFGATLTLSACVLDGDFDVQVDYELLQWPAHSGVRAQLQAVPLSRQDNASINVAMVERMSAGQNDFGGADLPSEIYDTWAAGYAYTGFTPTADTDGTLRLVRVGGTLSGYYSVGGGWMPVGSFAPATGAFRINLTAGSYTPAFTSQQTRVAFDNFVINRGLLDCSPRPAPTPHVACSGTGTVKSQPICTNTTWSLAQSPIRVTQTLSVGGGCPAGAAPTLTIEPGVEVCFSDNAALNIAAGTLFARGTADETILFTSSQTSPTPGAWDGIRFENGAVDAGFDANGHFTGGSILARARVIYAKDSDNRGVVSATQSLPFLNEVTIRASAASTAVLGLDVQDASKTIRLRSVRVVSNSGRGSNGAGVRLWGNTVAEISGVAVLSNPGDGLFAQGGSRVTLGTSSIVANAGPGVRCQGRCDLSNVHSSYNGGEGLLSETASNGSIQGGTVFFNSGTGLYLYTNPGTASSWTVARDSVVGNRSGGIQVSNGNVIIRENCVAGNTRNPQSSTQGRAIRLFSPQVTLEKNTVVGNDASAIWVGTPPNVPISQNNLEGNAAPILEYGAAASAATLQAANNWWGGTSSTDVTLLVYDHNDDVSRGYVNFDQPDLAHGPIAGAPATGLCARCIADVAPAHWRGEYWNNLGYAGTPRMIRDDGAMLRDDGTGRLKIDFGADRRGSPSLACGIATDAFSARWTGTANFAQSGTYRFSCTSDDTCQVYVDGRGTSIIDLPGGPVKTSPPVDWQLTAGNHTLRVDFREHTYDAVLDVSWHFTGSTATPTHTATSTVTLTPRPSPTFMPTATFTKTGTVTPTRTPTITPTPTLTRTPTVTPTIMRTPTATFTHTRTLTPTLTGTPPSLTQTPAAALRVGDASVASGQARIAVPILLENTVEVRAVQFTLRAEPREAVLSAEPSCSVTQRSTGLTCTCQQKPGSIDCVLLSTGGAVISVGTGAVGTVFVDHTAPGCQHNIALSLHDTLVSDVNVNPVSHVTVDGTLMCGCPEDVNCDGRVNVFDALTCVDVALGREPVRCSAADINNDGPTNVFDCLLIVDSILGRRPRCPL